MSVQNVSATMSLAQVDIEHLARQALNLFSKRYSMMYEMLAASDVNKSGYATYEEFLKMSSEGHPPGELEEARKMADITWNVATGGIGSTKVKQIDRQQLIDRCLENYHSKDKKTIKLLTDAITIINRYHFDLMDTNKDGFISQEEFKEWSEMKGDKDTWPGAFAEMDLNGDGLIDGEEFLKCGLGFAFHIDEARYNNFFGALKE